MSAPSKFLFDVDFSGPPKAKSAEPTITVAAHQAALADMQANSYRAGVAAGVAEAEQRGAAALAAVAARLEPFAADLAGLQKRIETEAIEIAFAVSRKLCQELMQKEPLAEIAAMAGDCFQRLVAAPHVVIRVAESVQEPVTARLTEVAHRCGFDGRLVILGEPGLRVGDCRIEWADGGMVRDQAATERNIAEVVGRYIAARRESVA